MATTAGPKAATQLGASDFAASAAAASTRAPPKVTPVPIPKLGSQPSVPGQVRQPSANPSVAPASSASAVRPNHDAVRPIIQDGRVRSPMPGKLKGKLDKKKGMFGVMLMTGPTTSDIGKRDAEAKRASESTQLAAEQALASREGTTRRRKFVRLPPEPEQPPPSSFPPPPPQPTPPTAPAAPPVGFYGLTDAGIKAEQARLLTVLRSLNPVQVVDQVCTALAFFGGIPGAPPPPNGAFPPSAMANGSGRLFVSWIAEIFPPLPNYGPPMPPVPMPRPAPELVDLTQETTESGARKRGRPKGSKSSRPRKDKGIKKGPVWARPTPAPKVKSGRPVGRPRKERPPDAANPGEESWVDVDQEEEENEHSIAAPEQAPAPDSAPAASEVSPSVRTALPSGSQGLDVELTPRRRGRPKGAKPGLPKVPATGDVGSSSEGSQPPQSSPAQQLPPVPRFAPTSAALTQPEGNPVSFTPVNSASAAQIEAEAAAQPETQSKRKGGKAKGSKSKAIADQSVSTADINIQSTTNDKAAAASGVESASAAPASYGQPPYTQYPSTSTTQPTQTVTLTLPQAPPQAAIANPIAQPPVTTQKRKRKSKNVGQGSISGVNNDTQAIAQQALETTGFTLPNNNETSEAQQGSPRQLSGTHEPSLAQPPAKRQRKSKDTKPNAKSNAKVNANAAVQPPVADTSTISDASRESFGHGFQAATQASAQDSMSLDVDHALSSLQSPHDDTHFDVESPTMENYQAQLQAQLEQESEPEPDPSTVMQQTARQNSVDTRQLMANQLQQQQYQQNRYKQRQQQSQQPQQSALQVSQSSTGHARSPSLQQQVIKSQQEGPRSSQPASRASQNSFTQYRPTNVQYGKPQSYSPQQGTLQTTQSQQYPTATQQQQYNTTQQQYPSGQSQYSGAGQQQSSAQSSYPQQLVSAAGSSSFTATQSPQFATTNNGFSATDGSYRGSGTSVNVNSPFNPLQRSLTASTASNGYRSGSAQNRSPSTFDASSISQAQHERTSSNTSSQSLQNSALQSFAAGSNPTAGWDLFDTSNSAPNQSQNMASYGIGGGAGSSARSTPSGASGFAHSAQSGLGGFDTSGLGTGNDRFYGVGRR
ncbi:hypothetical protein CONLIGDRAFT_639071 [Coniochaeta ligniaria NRRL 30616]|uniref:Uncharacterized protein n=1 Tax=Coniochaeta ligniaria NRRL 30616 TaxID=1408157 RepID=A0A1J7JXC5_9PEZI|nr:hypothetical protein CONLIGDRAFT_639071 [Coniochaeta ligniaria NRRL 30616]